MISAAPEERPKLDEVITRPIFNANVTSSDELLKDDTLVFKCNLNSGKYVV